MKKRIFVAMLVSFVAAVVFVVARAPQVDTRAIQRQNKQR